MTVTGCACPSCLSADTWEVMRRESVPVHQNLTLDTAAQARAMARGNLILRFCPACGLLFNAAFDPSLLTYGEAYENTQAYSGVFEAHMDSVVSMLLREGLRRKRVLEVGCGRGDFLLKLSEAGDNEGLGYDVSYAGPAFGANGRVRFVKAFLDAPAAVGPVDAVIARHVIEHVQDTRHFLSSLRTACGAETAVYIETPSLEWILDGAVFWDLFFEHSAYFSTTALENALLATGFEPVRTERVFGGQYLAVEARPGESQARPHSGIDHAKLLAFCRRQDATLARWRSDVERWADRGTLCVWGAGAKGATFVNLVDPEARQVDFVVDINPRKQGRFVPGTGHLVTDPVAISHKGVTDVVLMNPNYRDECQGALERLGSRAQLHLAE